MTGDCKVCGAHRDLRMGVCFDCVEMESIIATGLDMYDRGLDKAQDVPAKTAMDKLKLLVQKGFIKTK